MESHRYTRPRTWTVPVPRALFESHAIEYMNGVVASLYLGERSIQHFEQGDKLLFYPEVAACTDEKVPVVSRTLRTVHCGDQSIESIISAMPLPTADIVPPAAVLRGVQDSWDAVEWYRSRLQPLPMHTTVGFTFAPPN